MAQSVTLNELLASNSNSNADASGEFDDWMELYNNTNTEIDLSGYFLSNDAMDLQKWTFPAGTSIGANDYLIVWADNDTNQTGLHCSFKLKKAGASIYFSNAECTLIDETSFTTQTSDISWGRYENGTGPFIAMNPSFNSENNGALNVSSITDESDDFVVFPNPAKDAVTIIHPLDNSFHIKIYNIHGVLKYESVNWTNSDQIDVSTWGTGIYFIMVDESVVKLIIL